VRRLIVKKLCSCFRIGGGQSELGWPGTCVLIAAVERWKYWWNAESAPQRRCDILLYCDAGAWWIEVRHGGGSGHSYWREYPDIDAAVDRVRELMVGPYDWLQID
jgi:hypothetical protein